VANYYPKSVIRIRGEFTDLDTGAYVDPGTDVWITVQKIGSTASSIYKYSLAQLTKTGTGIYDLYFNTTGLAAGEYAYEVYGSGTNQAVNQGTFTLLQSKIT